MATTQISDIYEPVAFNDNAQEAMLNTNAFFQSGIVARDGVLDQMATNGGRIGDLPLFYGLADNEPNYSSDNPGVTSTADKISSELQKYRKAIMNKSYSTMDLSRELNTTGDVLGAITGRVGGYWSGVLNRRIIQSSLGVLVDNTANDGSDMLFSIATDDAGAVAAAEKISSDAVISAKATLGDRAGSLQAVALHSVVYSELQRQEVIQYEKAAGTNIMFPTYLGYRVVVDDALPAIAGTNRITYTSILFGSGAFTYGAGSPVMPSEVERKPDSGNGGGEEILYTRRSDIIHPVGFSFESGSVAAESPTEAELALAANWNRVYEHRKSAPMAFLQTNG